MTKASFNCPKCKKELQPSDFLGVFAVKMFSVTCRNCYEDIPVDAGMCIMGAGLWFVVIILCTITFNSISNLLFQSEVIEGLVTIGGIIAGAIFGGWLSLKLVYYSLSK